MTRMAAVLFKAVNCANSGNRGHPCHPRNPRLRFVQFQNLLYAPMLTLHSMLQLKPSSPAVHSLPGIGLSWIMLRLVLIAVVLAGSAARPSTPLEKEVAVWPPAPSS